MNLTASNSVQRAWPGDIGTLPYVGQWKQIVLPDGQVLLWSWEDLKGAFYLFGLSGEWSPLFAFDQTFRLKDLKDNVAEESDRDVWIGATTIPMGWVNAMGLAQYLHRRMHELGMKM
eukprot:5877313-Karenia_brevis.AAC.1